MRISPEGWQIVAGDGTKRKPPEEIRKKLHHEVVPESQTHLSDLAPVGVRSF